MKSTVGTKRELQLDRVFGALSCQTRRGLLARMSEQPTKISELAAPYAMSLPAVSKHIRVLERAGLVRRTIDGRVHRCSLNPGPLRSASEWLDHYEVFWSQTLDSLAAYVEEE